MDGADPGFILGVPAGDAPFLQDPRSPLQGLSCDLARLPPAGCVGRQVAGRAVREAVQGGRLAPGRLREFRHVPGGDDGLLAEHPHALCQVLPGPAGALPGPLAAVGAVADGVEAVLDGRGVEVGGAEVAADHPGWGEVEGRVARVQLADGAQGCLGPGLPERLDVGEGDVVFAQGLGAAEARLFLVAGDVVLDGLGFDHLGLVPCWMAAVWQEIRRVRNLWVSCREVLIRLRGTP